MSAAAARRWTARIAMSDGVELAGDVSLPAGDGPWPVLVMHVPYRANDFLAASFEYHNQYFVAAGYAVVVVDFRGLGASGGRAAEAFSSQEGRDSFDAIEWAAGQPWSSGAVGMWGVSYGAITALRAAAQAPPHLGAIVAVQGTSDLYGTVYPGGALNLQGAVGAWGSLMLALQLLPPSGRGDFAAHREDWQRRLRATEPYVMPWLGHPTLDEFWRDKQTRVEAVNVPTFLIGGWRDIFADDVVRDYEALTAPKKLWMGPWMHGSPDFAPAHGTDHLPAMLAWWDRWLRDEPNGLDDDPPVALFVQNGTWRHERAWPIDRTVVSTFVLTADGRLAADEKPEREAWLPYRGEATVGVTSGLWEPLALGGGGPREQSADDARSLCFTSGPLGDAREVTGRPRARLRLRVHDGADAVVVARLCEVLTTGESLLITAGHLRLSHRTGHDERSAIPSDRPGGIDIELGATSYSVRAGSRLRLAISTSLFPQLGLEAAPPVIEVAVGVPGGSLLEVPVVPGATEVSPAARFGPVPVGEPELRRPLVRAATPVVTLHEDWVGGTLSVSSGMKLSFETADRGGVVDVDHLATCSGSPDGRSPALLVGRTEIRMAVADAPETVVQTTLRVEGAEMELTGTVLLDGAEHFQHRWDPGRRSGA